MQLPKNRVETVLVRINKPIDGDDRPVTIIVAAELFKSRLIAFNHHPPPSVQNEIPAIAEVNSVPCSEFTTHLRSRSDGFKDESDDSVFSKLGIDVLLMDKNILYHCSPFRVLENCTDAAIRETAHNIN